MYTAETATLEDRSMTPTSYHFESPALGRAGHVEQFMARRYLTWVRQRGITESSVREGEPWR